MSGIVRSMKRDLARFHMLKEGKKQINKHSYTSIKSPVTGAVSTTREPSYFAENWRDYVKPWEEK